MYYLLKLEVGQIIRKGIQISLIDINHKLWGLLWDGTAFRKLSEKYKVGDVINKDIYVIDYSYMAIDDYGLGDYVDEDMPDLLEHDLAPQWDDLSKPCVFLMSIKGYATWTDCGEEYDIEHHSVKVVTNFEALNN